MPVADPSVLRVPVARRLASGLLAVTILFLQLAPVIATEITTDLWVYNDGDTVTVSGIDFGPEETVEIITTDPVGVEVDRGTAQTNGAGAFTYQFVLTVTESGIYDVVGTGLTSGLSASTQFDPPPNPPTNLWFVDARAAGGNVTLSWSAPASGSSVDCYRIYRSAAPISDWSAFTTSAATACTATVDGRTPLAFTNAGILTYTDTTTGGSDFYYRVSAHRDNPNQGESAPTNQVATASLNTSPPTTHDFGNQATGTTSAAQTFTVTNNGDSAIAFQSVTKTGANTGDFAVSGAPAAGTSIAVGANFTFDVTFTPGALGARSATLQINASSSGQTGATFNTRLAPVSGTGVAPDTTAPVGSVEIDTGAAFTNSTSVSLHLLATDAVGVTGYVVANASTCPTSGYTAVGPTTSLDTTVGHSLIAGDGVKTVCARFRDAASNTSNATDTISLDQTKPTTTITGNPSNPTNSTSATFTFTSNDPVTGGVASGVNHTECQLDGGGFSTCVSGVTYGGPLSGGSHTFDVRAVDNAGNTGLSSSFTWFIDASPPAASITINDGDAWTNNAAVLLDLTGTDNVGITRYRLAETQVGLGSATDVPVSPAEASFGRLDVAFNLTGADSSAKAVWLRVCDAANNCTDASDTLGLDRVAPVITDLGPTTSPVNGWYNHDVDNEFAAADVLSGLSASCLAAFSEPGDQQTKTTSGEGYDLTVFSDSCTDVAGNTATALESAEFDVDQTAPNNVTVTPDRGPDHGGWYNAPFSAMWDGDDALSGIDFCTASIYGGPDTAAGQLSGTCTDVAGNESGPVTFDFMYDATDPHSIVGTPDRTPDRNGWYNHALDVDFAGVDDTSGIDFCDQDVPYSGPDSAIAQVLGSCTDKAGNSASDTFDFMFDDSDPSVSIDPDRPTDFGGWYNAPVIFDTTGSDGTSGLVDSDCTANQTYSGPDTATAQVTGSCMDIAGNSASDTFDFMFDDTNPTVSVNPARSPDFAGWYNAPVIFNTSGTDDTSGVLDANCSANYNWTSPDGTGQTRMGICTDNAGNVGTGNSAAFDFDDTNPAVTVTPDRSPDMNGWYNHAVAFDTNGTDGTSGIQACDPDQTYSGPDGTGLTVSGSCTDNAGNVGNGTSAAFKFDDTNPTASVTFPVNGGSYIESSWDAGCSTPAGDFCGTAADPLSSGVASGVDHTIASIKDESTGNWWNWTTTGFTSAVEDFTPVGGTAWNQAFAYANFPLSGDFTVHAVAVDVAGNTGGASSTFTLNRYTLDYQQPLDDSILPTIIRNTGKYGRVIPGKVQVYKDGVLQTSANFAPTDVFTIGVNHMTSCAAAATDGIEMYADAGAANGNTNMFRWADSQLIYNLDTKAPPQIQMVIGQCYRLNVYLNGVKLSYSRTAVFQPIK